MKQILSRGFIGRLASGTSIREFSVGSSKQAAVSKCLHRHLRLMRPLLSSPGTAYFQTVEPRWTLSSLPCFGPCGMVQWQDPRVNQAQTMLAFDQCRSLRNMAADFFVREAERRVSGYDHEGLNDQLALFWCITARRQLGANLTGKGGIRHHLPTRLCSEKGESTLRTPSAWQCKAPGPPLGASGALIGQKR